VKEIEDKSTYKKIVTDFRNSLSSLSELHSDFREFDDFYLAKHWNSKRASWKPDPIINYVSYIVDMKAPQLTNNRPSGLILPTAQDDEEAAKLFTQVTDVVSERLDLDDKIDQYVRTGLLLGTAFMKVYWDNSLSGGNPNKGNMWKGDIAIDMPDPSNIYPDPQATSINECRYIIYAVPKTIQWIEQKFNVKLDSENNFETEIYDRPSATHGKDRAMFFEYWHKDKNGIHCTYAAGGKILKKIQKVFKHGRYPFVPFVPKKNRKTLWGIGEPKNIISNQKLLNKLVELPTTNAILHANPIVLIDPRSGINPKQWQNKPGQIWNAKDPGNAIHIVQPPTLNNDVYKLSDKMTEYIEKIGGVYDAVTGSTPKGVTAAAAIQMLQEQGSMPIKGISRNLYQSIKDIYELMIELIKENYTETRYIRILDEDGSYEFKEFNASQYAELDFDVKVSAGASTPTSKAYIAQLGSELFDKQILLPSEYVEMQEGLPNKDKIVQRLREMEGMQAQPPNPNTPQAPQQAVQPEQPLDFDSFVQNAPPELQQEISLMMEQGMNEEQIMQMLLAPQ
jgi:hypothetical protein